MFRAKHIQETEDKCKKKGLVLTPVANTNNYYVQNPEQKSMQGLLADLDTCVSDGYQFVIITPAQNGKYAQVCLEKKKLLSSKTKEVKLKKPFGGRTQTGGGRAPAVGTMDTEAKTPKIHHNDKADVGKPDEKGKGGLGNTLQVPQDSKT